MGKQLNTKQAPIYGDTKVLAPDGQLLFLCLPKKANWYLERNLATIINEDPMVVQLTFEPKGRSQAMDEYALELKHNKCVVCGTDEDLTSHHIVPHTYRKHFPEHIKSHSSHDVCPMCVDHHTEYEEEYVVELKYIFGQRYNAPLEAETKINCDLSLVVSYSNLLLDNWCSLPYHRKKQMIKAIREYHGPFGKLMKVLLIYAYVDLSKTKTESHGQYVVEQLMNENLLQWFVETWREHFIHSMNPKYMPEHWDLQRPIEGINNKN